MSNEAIRHYAGCQDYHCYNRILASICTSFREEHELLFLNAWNFRYDPTHRQSFGGRIHVSAGDSHGLLDACYHIRSQQFVFNDPQALWNHCICELAAGRLFVVRIAYHHMPWRPQFDVDAANPAPFPFLITGYSDGSGFDAYDVHSNGERRLIPKEVLLNHSRELLCFAKSGDFRWEDCRQNVVETLARLPGKIAPDFRQMRQMARDFLEDFDLEDEAKGYPLYFYVPVNFALFTLAGTRRLFGKALDAVNSHTSLIPLEILYGFYRVSAIWHQLRLLIEKAHFRGDMDVSQKKRVSDAITQATALEEDLCQKLSAIDWNGAAVQTKASPRVFTTWNNLQFQCQIMGVTNAALNAEMGKGIMKSSGGTAEIVIQSSAEIQTVGCTLFTGGARPLCRYQYHTEGGTWTNIVAQTVTSEPLWGNRRVEDNLTLPCQCHFFRILLLDSDPYWLPSIHRLEINSVPIPLTLITPVETGGYLYTDNVGPADHHAAPGR